MPGLTALLDLVSFTGLIKPTKTSFLSNGRDCETKTEGGHATARAGRHDQVRRITNTVINAHAELATLQDLSPGDITNRVLTELVSVCSEVHETVVVEEVLTNTKLQSILPSLRRICSEAEACLESHWNEHVVAGGNDFDEVAKRLESFPYYENYEEIARLELSALFAANKGSAPSKIAFIGSGPLPLTSLCLLKALKSGMFGTPSSPMSVGVSEKPQATDRGPIAEVLNIDCDKKALEMSAELGRKLGPHADGMKYTCSYAGASDSDLSAHDVVYLAALVGQSQTEKEAILLKVASKMRQGALVVVRTSWGLRTCLYPEVNLTTAALLEKLQICMVVHPYENVVNSVVIARVK